MNPSDIPIQVALSMAPDTDTAARIARTLVEERLAACVNVVPGVRSIYRWGGTIHEDGEVLLVAKTRADRMPRLADRLRELHPYDVPELVALPVCGGLEAYLAWVAAEAIG